VTGRRTGIDRARQSGVPPSAAIWRGRPVERLQAVVQADLRRSPCAAGPPAAVPQPSGHGTVVVLVPILRFVVQSAYPTPRLQQRGRFRRPRGGSTTISWNGPCSAWTARPATPRRAHGLVQRGRAVEIDTKSGRPGGLLQTRRTWPPRLRLDPEAPVPALQITTRRTRRRCPRA